MWARGEVISMQCPKSVVTSQSLDYLEKFRLWITAGGGALWDIDAKCADAILLLNEEWHKETENGKV